MHIASALGSVLQSAFGSVGYKRHHHSAPIIPRDSEFHKAVAERERARKAAARYDRHMAGVNGYHPIAQAARAVASTDILVKPKRARKPAAAKAV